MTGPLRLDRALIGVHGPDARGFLNNLLTQDLESLDHAGALYGALLTPQGKVVADMFIHGGDDGVLLEADPARGAELLRRLMLYKLRARVEIEDRSSDYSIVFAPAPLSDGAADPRFTDGSLGHRALRPGRVQYADGALAYEALRIALGVPDLARDAAAEEVFAGEALLEELNGVDFQKGCFVGQENVSRMKRRATTRRKFCAIACDGPPPSHGAPVRAGGVELGQVRSGAAGRAIALLRLDRALELIGKGEKLESEGRQIRLDPPSWLILPQREGADADSPD